MNAPAHITRDPIKAAQEAEAQRLKAIAQAVRAGHTAGLPRITERELYDLDQWKAAAEMAVECEDYSEFGWMMRREEAFQHYCADERSECIGYEPADFDDYFAKANRSSVVGMVS